MKRIFAICIFCLVVKSIYCLNIEKVAQWVEAEYNIKDITVSSLQHQISGNELFIAYRKLIAPTNENYFGVFDRAIIFFEYYDILVPVVHFNGPVVVNSNGSRIFDFSGEKYSYLNFFGWEILCNQKGEITITLSLRHNMGKNVADSISMHYDINYKQFVVLRNPFDYNFSLDARDPVFIGIARNGYVEPNEFENTVDDELSKLTKEELRLCRNAIYAVHGYKFSDIHLLSYFYQYNWYKPGSKKDNELIVLTPQQEKLKKIILELEKK